MKKPLRFFLYATLAAGVLTAGGLGGASWYLTKKFGHEGWVEWMEKECNCRVQIEGSSLSLLTTPATLKLKNVQIMPRDAEVAKLLADRTPVADGTGPIVIPEVLLEVRLEELMKNRFYIESLRFVSPVIKEARDAQGKSSLSPLFKKPGEVEDPVVAAGTPPAAPAPAVQTPDGGKVDDAKMTFAAEFASIENGRITIEKGEATTTITNFNFKLSGFDVNNTDPEHRIRASLDARIQVVGLARIGGAKKMAEMADTVFKGEGQVRVRDPGSTLVHPTTWLTLTLVKGSKLGGHITMGDAAAKDMRKLQENGLDLAPVRLGGPLMQDAVMDGFLRDDRLTLGKPTLLSFPEYDIMIEPMSWIHPAQNLHELNMRLACGPDLQRRLTDGLAKSPVGDTVTSALTQALMDDKGRLTFDVESKGPLADPIVRPKIDLDRILKNLLKGDGLNNLLKGLLKKL